MENPSDRQNVIFIISETFWSSDKIGTIQRRLAWPLRKDDTHKSRTYHTFLARHCRRTLCSLCLRCEWSLSTIAIAIVIGGGGPTKRRGETLSALPLISPFAPHRTPSTPQHMVLAQCRRIISSLSRRRLRAFRLFIASSRTRTNERAHSKKRH